MDNSMLRRARGCSCIYVDIYIFQIDYRLLLIDIISTFRFSVHQIRIQCYIRSNTKRQPYLLTASKDKSSFSSIKVDSTHSLVGIENVMKVWLVQPMNMIVLGCLADVIKYSYIA